MAIYNNDKDPNDEMWDNLNAPTGEDPDGTVDLGIDEEWDTTYAVDIPQCFNGDPIDEMRTVAEFKTQKEAIEYARKHFGADENGMICLISSY